MCKKACIIRISGIVQSVGFRPFIYRIFEGFSGWVKNTPNGVLIYLEGELEDEKIKSLIFNNAPANAKIEKINIICKNIKRYAFDRFFIKKSSAANIGGVFLPPDLGICEKCKEELFDENNRRYLHPFINCTDCGPRFSIITDSPYDRDKTTMKHFKMCDECKKEYENPKDRRFHAQPIACNLCGPEYFLIEEQKVKAKGQIAIKKAALKLADSKVGLVKGIGGYHLMCNALNDSAVDKIKFLKNRYKKPFAVIAKDIETVKKYCFISDEEKRILLSQAKPIVLLRLKNRDVFKSVRMDSPYLGVMLAYAPIHLLLFWFSDFEFMVATSANFTEKPLIYNDKDAINFIGADFVLTNNRRIVRPIEDSIIGFADDKPVLHRYGRGYAPGVFLRKTKPNILALGGDLKNNIALSFKDRVVLSQYTGDLSEYDNYMRFIEKVEDFLKYFNFKPDMVVCDKHPEYFSTNYALENFEDVEQIQHHIAHFGSVLLEYNMNPNAIGVIMDGTGFGEDGNVWGGEFFVKIGKKIERVGHIEYMPFAFGDVAVREPYRLAISWLLSLGIKNHWLLNKYPNITSIAKKSSFVKTSSAGRLFDVISVMLGIKERSEYEAEAAISLMNKAFYYETDKLFEFDLNNFNVDFRPTIKQIANLENKNRQSEYAAIFHKTFVEALKKNILNISRQTKIENVVLSGGVFQNHIILNGLATALIKHNLKVYFNSSVPINDGGISMGQIFFSKGADGIRNL